MRQNLIIKTLSFVVFLCISTVLSAQSANDAKSYELPLVTLEGGPIVKHDMPFEKIEPKYVQYDRSFVYHFDGEKCAKLTKAKLSKARLIAQMYLVNENNNDTSYLCPIVMDGSKYRKSVYMDALDSLALVAPALGTQLDSVILSSKIEVLAGDRLKCYARIVVKDQNKVLYSDEVFAYSLKATRSLFGLLEYAFDECRVDHNEHFRAPRKERIGAAKNMKLQFKVGRVELDKSDSLTVESLNSLKQELKQICDEILKDRDAGRKSSTSLDDIYFEGYSSPEGSYVKNQALSNARTQAVRTEVFSVIPKFVQDRLNTDRFKGFVCGWDEVANILERDSLKAEAEAVRAIVAKYPGNLDRQGVDIRQLPYYNTLIKVRFGELRQVKCNYSVSIERALYPEEILANYNNGRKTNLTLNEYWHLFTLVKDETELENLYRDAYDRSKGVDPLGRPWVLAANNLAISYLKREHVDTTILKSHLVDGRPMNYSEMDMINPNIRHYYNCPEIIATQAQMYMLAGNYHRAVQLTDKVKMVYPVLDAIAKFIGGYENYIPDTQSALDQIEETTPRNKVLVRLARRQYDSVTVSALMQLPQEDAMTDYLKAMRLCMQYKDVHTMRNKSFNLAEDPNLSSFGEEATVYEVAKFYLKRCFEKDSNFINFAKEDSGINELLLNEILK